MSDCNCQFVIFGATGDLACKKLLPALYHLMSWNQSLWIGTLRLIPGARRARLVVTQGINPVMQINRSPHLCHPFGRYPRPALGKSLHR